MRFLYLYRPGKPETNAPPTQEEMATMGKLIDDMAKAGVLLAVEGCLPSSKGFRVRIESGKFSVTDGPFPGDQGAHRWPLHAASEDDRLRRSNGENASLAIVGEGESEIRQLHDVPAA